MSTHLFKFEDLGAVGGLGPSTQGGGTGGSPALGHVGDTNDGTAKKSSGETFVDVVREFPWTNSPETAREDAPYIDLKESRIASNPMLNQIATHLAVMSNIGPRGEVDEDQRAAIKQKFTEATDKLEGEYGIISATGTVLKGGLNALKTADGPMFNYSDLYNLHDTGWRYRLPYYTDSYRQLLNQFSDNQGQTGGGIGGKVLEGVKSVADIAAQASQAIGGSFLGPGQYIETSKFYSFGGREKSYQFNFPLSNTTFTNETKQIDSITKNWELIYLLVYQNLPNRVTRDLVIPPCVYEANIPGTMYSPYAYISGINVEFIGTRRMMTLNIPTYTGGFKAVKAIIPDVYGVTITVTELHGEAQNMMAYMVNKDDIITTG